ncbi:MAG: enoyl-CoA hydratase-related protein [Thermoanaerobaculia bacterium]
MSASVLLEGGGSVATLTLNRPPLNILDLEMIAALGNRLAGLADDDSLQLLILRGAGEKAFSVGVAVQEHTPDKVDRMLDAFHSAILTLRRLPAVTLAVIRGHCLGGGMELAAGCDLRLAAETSRFGQPEIDLGCFPPLAAALYPRWLGGGRALDLLATGRILSAQEAERIGFVTRRVPDARVDEEVQEITDQLTSKSRAVTRILKRAILAGREGPFEAALAESERLYRQDLVATEDMREGLTAFLEKRPPRWKHR